MKKIIPLLLLAFLFTSSSKEGKQSANQVTQFVNPFIGTGGHGHTFPGAVVPFGMVQLSPDTRTNGWDACGGYYTDDKSILGFSHRHLSGTGMTDFADVLFTPFIGKLKMQNDTLQKYYPLAFSHQNEIAKAGYYKVAFDNGIQVELTASTRAGFHKYQFPAGESGIIIDLHHNLHNQKVLQSNIEIISNTEIRGMRLTEGWAKRDYVYFYAKFDKPYTVKLYKQNKEVSGNTLNDENVKAVLTFDNPKEVNVKVGISPVDEKGALNNLDTEIPDWDFEKVRSLANDSWEQQLRKIIVEGGSNDEKIIFYTGLYHAFIHPSTYSDVDKRYRGQDLKIHTLEKGTYYTVFSLWDTFRAQMPLVSLIQPSKTNEFINSMLLNYQQGGLLPMWALASNYTGTMIGAHATSIIADAYTKGILGYDTDLAYKAMKRSIPYDTTGIKVNHPAIWEWLMTKGKKYNEEIGFIPADKDVIFATSRGLEYAYCDWALAQVAKDMNKNEDYKWLSERGTRYKKYFDPTTGFMRALDSNGKFIGPFNPSYSNHMNSPYCEGNAWQWTWFVPQDVPGLINLMGGKNAFEKNLDALFNTKAVVEGEEASADISGLIGQYAHGNEPSHHIIYFYNYINKAFKTQELADKIMKEQYRNAPDGLTGNEDCGQMSSWYIFNALGFYQVAPGDPTYTISRPLFDKANITLENGKTLIIKAQNNSAQNKYVASVSLNGKRLKTPFFRHADIVNGGEMVFKMTDKKQ
ncbi:GH92 family glycosyl hydrolase [Flavobacterium nackdongense]|uniref:Glycoside hydrolase family 92 protein n=1 Tax=Flavobacterium nackdongense TaxID=2547394 RepID=A0A4P6Y9W2_9FLAO|nr:GH92 family glycosyl hydrolase [Flavobacterium nackdongense]QBN17405.1 glycoside hydrolase family 92 protein [Flavobacterium nackdongense]